MILNVRRLPDSLQPTHSTVNYCYDRCCCGCCGFKKQTTTIADALADAPSELDHAMLLSMGVTRAADRQRLLTLTDRHAAAKRRFVVVVVVVD
jgi:hypothetical protein